ncbi:MAG: hypothetical protein AAFR61_29370 [Bacteroidota bacterium]
MANVPASRSRYPADVRILFLPKMKSTYVHPSCSNQIESARGLLLSAFPKNQSCDLAGMYFPCPKTWELHLTIIRIRRHIE